MIDDHLTAEVAQYGREALYHRLEDDLLRQIQLCARNQQLYAHMEGATNLEAANRFKILEQRCARDLQQLKNNFQQGSKVPIFHYEKRQMNIIQVNTDLSDSELEVSSTIACFSFHTLLYSNVIS
jgi:hypothetical protein